MVNWLGDGRDQNRRVEVLEHELGELKAAAASSASRVDDLSNTVDALAERLSRIVETLSPMEERGRRDSEEFAKQRTSLLSMIAGEIERVRELSVTVSALSKAVAVLEEVSSPEAAEAREKRLDDDRLEAVKTRTSVLRLERQLNIFVEEARRTDNALLERIEALRLGDQRMGTSS